MADSTNLPTLENIRKKIRRLIKAPSTSQITDAQLDDYINTFVLYDIPQELKLDILQTTLIFYTQPYKDIYENSDDPNSDLYNIKNIYSMFTGPLIIGGRVATLFNSKQQFYNYYPPQNYKETIGTGTGTQSHFSGTLEYKPILQKSLYISSVGLTGEKIVVYDNGQGQLEGDTVFGSIDYKTGSFDIDFSNCPGINEEVYAQYEPIKVSKPTALLAHGGQFILRPVPDKVYKVEIQAYRRPTILLENGDNPDLAQWWQYIAYGAAKKIFEERMDQNSLNLIFPELHRQEILVLRRTISQLSQQRAATIYDGQTSPTNKIGDF